MSIISKVEEYFYFEDEICDKINTWAKSRCDTFLTDPRNNEQPLRHTQLHEEYCELFEQIIENFLTNENISLKCFYEEVRKDVESRRRNRLDESVSFASALTGAIDFLYFCELMNDVRLGNGVVFCPPLVAIDDEIAMPKTSVITSDKESNVHENKNSASHKTSPPESSQAGSKAVNYENDHNSTSHSYKK